MSIYQAADGRYIYFDGVEKRFFDTEGEAIAMSRKETFVQKLQEAATQIAVAADRFEDLETIFFDRGYNSGGANQIQDEDIEATGLTAAQVGSLITFGQQLQLFLNAGAVVQGDYDVTLNAARTDI
jgi:hypothetical protein